MPLECHLLRWCPPLIEPMSLRLSKTRARMNVSYLATNTDQPSAHAAQQSQAHAKTCQPDALRFDVLLFFCSTILA